MKTATIEITKTAIEYDPKLAQVAGCLEITNGAPPIVAPNGDSLLHLAFYLVYTAEGRQLLRDNRPWGDASEVAQVRANLKTTLRGRFPTLADDRLDTVIDAHFAADGYVSAVQTNDSQQMARQQAIYSQKLLAILGALHDDAMGHNFSLDW
jgi:hypothetical protein